MAAPSVRASRAALLLAAFAAVAFAAGAFPKACDPKSPDGACGAVADAASGASSAVTLVQRTAAAKARRSSASDAQQKPQPRPSAWAAAKAAAAAARPAIDAGPRATALAELISRERALVNTHASKLKQRLAHHAGSYNKFNLSKCASPQQIMETFDIQNTFDPSKVKGIYYQLAFQDYTQYPACPNARCVQAVKSEETYPNGEPYILDDWSITCFDINYEQDLLFNFTDINGHFRGYWPEINIPGVPPGLLRNIVFPNTFAAFKLAADSKSYEWVIEVQCRDCEDANIVTFTGINFYSQVRTQQAYDEMYAAATKIGLQPWMDAFFGWRIMDHSNCNYPVGPPSGPIDWPKFGA